MKQKGQREPAFSLRPLELSRSAPAAKQLVPCLLILALTGCSSTPVTVVERVNVPTYIPISATLTAPVSLDLGQNPTWGSALGAYNAAFQTCQGQLEAIKTLKSPTPPSSQGSPSPPYKPLRK